MLFARLPSPIFLFFMSLSIRVSQSARTHYVRLYVWFTSSANGKSHAIRVPFRYKIYIFFFISFPFSTFYILIDLIASVPMANGYGEWMRAKQKVVSVLKVRLYSICLISHSTRCFIVIFLFLQFSLARFFLVFFFFEMLFRYSVRRDATAS